MNRQAGFITYLLVFVVAAAAFIFLFYALQKYSPVNSFTSVATSSQSSTTGGVNPLLNFGPTAPIPSNSSNSNTPSKGSPYAGQINISLGNASSEYQPDSEYIQLYNSGNSSVAISGWTLENAYGNRPIQTTGNQAVNVSPEKVTIPLGTNFLNPSGVFVTSPIILQPGDTAIVTTGGPFVSYPFKISESFRLNECSGYLNYTYPFEPQINDDCPSPQNESGIGAITDVCYNYVRYLQRCYDPAVQDAKNLRNNFQQNCIDYIDQHFSYSACVANHENDTNFNESTWRIFLGLNHELWHEPDDSVKLFDQNGKLVDEIDY